jgi:hypothetical protein
MLTISSAAAAALRDSELSRNQIAAAVCWSDWFGGVPGSLRFPFSVHSESQNHFFDLFAARVGKTLVMTGYREAAFCQHPDRGDVILGSPRINGTRLQVAKNSASALVAMPRPQYSRPSQ